jgi:hypothetical protein
MRALALITDEPSDIVYLLLSETAPTDAIVASFDPTYASKDVSARDAFAWG